jgi:hypothetical protein
VTGSPGYLALDDKTYRFDSATWSLQRGHLYLDAESRRCALSLVGVPFKDVSKPEELVGKRGLRSGTRFHRVTTSSPKAAWRFEVNGTNVTEIRVEVRAFNAETGVLKIAIQMKVEGEDSGYTGDVDCYLACEPDRSLK